MLAEALWDAGVPREVLQYVQFSDRSLGTELVSHEAVERVILTGGYETAVAFREARPDLELLAETSGKNAIIITPHADYDLAVRDVLASAYGHAGQKCSAASLVVLVGQAGRSPRLRNQLVDGVKSLRVGPPTDPLAKMGPIMSPAEGKLLRGLTTLGEGETWIIEPKQLDDEGKLWTPGLRSGVKRGSEYHLTEYFGPILGVMQVDTLAEAIDVVNEVDYGLTSGLHSLNRDEIAQWLDGIHAGNLYVNRGITGAIVQRQPFGGWKKSVVGATVKAGGPNYLVGMGEWDAAPATESAPVALESVRALVAAYESDAPATDGDALVVGDASSLARAAGSDQLLWEQEFGVARDVQGMAAERNVFRYLPFDRSVVIRVAEGGTAWDAVRLVAAAWRAGVTPLVSTAVELPAAVAGVLARYGAAPTVGASGVTIGAGASSTRVVVETDAEFLASDALVSAGRIRFVGSDEQARALSESIDGSVDVAIWRRGVTESGRLELLPFLHEQAVSITAHRFGTPDGLTDGLLA